MQIKKQEKIYLGVIFLFFLSILLFIPITGDDWYNYAIGKQGMTISIQNTILMYFTWEGRIISRILIYFLTYHRIFYCIFTSFLITSFCYVVANFFKTKYKLFIYAIIIIFLLTLENTMWTQSFLWVAGSVTYLFPCIFIIGYLYYYFHFILERDHLKWYIYFLFGLFSFFITMFVENLAFTFVVSNFLLLVYHYYKKRKISWFLLLNCVFSFIGALFMLISPGSTLRLIGDDDTFQKLSFFSKIKFNVPNFLYYTFLCSVVLVVVFSIVFFLLIRRVIKKKFVRILSYFLIFPPLGYIIIMLICRRFFQINVLWNFAFSNLYLFVFVSILLCLVFLFLVFKFLEREQFFLFLLFSSIALSSNIVMLLSPVWGGRVGLFTVFLLFYILLYLMFSLVSIKNVRVSIYVSVGGLIASLFMIGVLISYYQVYEFTKFREKIITEQVKQKRSYITIYTMDRSLLWGNDPYDEFHIKYFKEYYHISKESRLIYACRK